MKSKKISLVLFVVVAAFCGLCAQASDVIGFGKTIDDETGEAKSIVQIYEADGKICGKVLDPKKGKTYSAQIWQPVKDNE